MGEWAGEWAPEYGRAPVPLRSAFKQESGLGFSLQCLGVVHGSRRAEAAAA